MCHDDCYRGPLSIAIALVLLVAFTLSSSLLLPSVSAEPMGDVIIVDVGGKGDYVSVDDAITAASDGDTIRIWEGVYTGDLVIDKRLTIIGNGTHETLIQGSGTGNATVVTSDWVNISYLGVTGSKWVLQEPPPYYSGILLQGVENCTIDSVRVFDNYAGVLLESSSNNTVRNVNASGNMGGIGLVDSHNNTVVDNNITDNMMTGIYLEVTQDNIINNNHLQDNGGTSIHIKHSTFDLISDNHLSHSSDDGTIGMEVNESISTQISNNSISGFEEGIMVLESTDLILDNNTLYGNIYGMVFEGVRYPVVEENLIHDNDYGSVMMNTENAMVSNNTFHDNGKSSSVYENSDSLTIIDNSFHSSPFGIHVIGCTDFQIIGNDMENDIADIILQDSTFMSLERNVMCKGLVIEGHALASWDSHEMTTDNTVGGEPLIYLKDLTEESVSGPAGQVILVNCHDMIISSLLIDDVNSALILAFSDNNEILFNEFHGNGDAVYLWMSHGNNITDNLMSSSGNSSIYLRQSDDNLISNNDFDGGDAAGVHLKDSSNNEISNCTFSGLNIGIDSQNSQGNQILQNLFIDNERGLGLYNESNHNLVFFNLFLGNGIGLHSDSEGNIIVGNDFIGNDGHHAQDSGDNTWNLTAALGGGNFWYDHDLTDTTSDGYADSEYPISGGLNTDHLPLLKSLDDVAPQAYAGEDVTAKLGESIVLDGSGSSDDRAIANHSWYITEDDVTLYGEKPSYSFTSPGEYEVVLTVTDYGENTDVHEITVTVIPHEKVFITDVHELQNIKENLYGNYILANDIDASDTENWNDGKGFSLLGNISVEDRDDMSGGFFGTLDGNGYNITGLHIHRPETFAVGLFALISPGGSVKNMTMNGLNVTGGEGVGGLAGANFGEIRGCHLEGEVTGQGLVGGVVSMNAGSISETVSMVEVTATGTFSIGDLQGASMAGGLAGMNEGELEDCHAYGDVQGDIAVGGLVAMNVGYMGNSTASGNVTAASFAGGLAAMSDGVVHRCSASGDVSVNDVFEFGPGMNASMAGGLLGMNDGTLTDSNASGNVEGVAVVGGLVAGNNGTILNCYATGDVTATGIVEFGDPEEPIDASMAGGLVALNMATIESCDASGDVQGKVMVAGLVAFNMGNVSESHAHGDVIAEVFVGGLVAFNQGNITKSSSNGQVEATEETGDFGASMAGGLVAFNMGNVSESHAHGAVIGLSVAGGLMGLNEGKVEDCLASGPVTARDIVGGLIALNNGTVERSNASGAVIGQNYTGGLVGMAVGGVIEDCSANGTVEGRVWVGGLVGHNEADISNSHYEGTVIGKETVGGLVGFNEVAIISQSHAIVTVSGTGDKIAGLVGDNKGTITGCHAMGQVQGGDNTAGLVAFNRGTVESSYFIGEVEGSDGVGGLVSTNRGSVQDSHSYADVKGGQYVGGLVGYNDVQGEVSGSHSSSDVQGVNQVGGLVGFNQNLIEDCHSSGTVFSTMDFAGGLVGQNNRDILTSYSLSDVDGGSYIGGLVGYNNVDGEVNNSYARGAVNGSTAIGGLVGWNKGLVDQSYSTGEVTGNTLPGGLIGFNEAGVVTASFWDNQTSLMMISEGGEGRNTTAMQTESTFVTAGWDLVSTWYIIEGNSYPLLSYQPEPLIADAGEDMTVIQGETMELDASGGSGAVNWTWTFVDGVPVTLYGEKVEHVFFDVGVYDVTLTVRDAEDNEDTDVVNINVISSDVPVLQIISPAEGSHIPSSDVLVEWTVDFADPYTVNISIDGVNWIEDAGEDHTFTGLGDGEYTVYAVAKSASGDSVPRTVTFTVDTKEPELEITSPLDGTLVNGTAVVTWTVDEDNEWHAEVAVDDGDWTNIGKVLEHEFTGLEEGARVIKVKVTDLAGNSNQSSLTLNVDTTEPSLDISFPEDGYHTNIESVLVEWTADDASPFTVNISYDGDLWEEPDTDSNHTFSLSVGENVLWVRAVDEVGNTNITTVTVTLDQTAPILDMVSPDDDSIHATSHVLVTWTVDEEYEWHAEVAVDDGDWTNIGKVLEHEFEDLEDGSRELKVRIVDQAGNSDMDSLTVNIDTTPPDAHAGVDQEVDEGSTVTFDGSASTDNIGIVNYTWTFTYDDTPVELHGVSPSFQFDTIGVYDVTLTVKDAAENSATDTMVVTVLDITPPDANAGVDQEVDEGSTVTFDGSASTDNIGIENYTWNFTYDGAALEVYGVSPSFVFNIPGTYTVTLTVKDAADNSDTDTMTVTVNDITDPVADAGPDQEVDEGSTVTFDGSGSTDNVGIVNYTWTFTYDDSPVVIYGVSPSFEFVAIGVYEVTLTVKDDADNSDTDTMTVNVLDATPPDANAGVDQEVDEGSTVTFDGSGSTDNIGIENYTWSLTYDDVLVKVYGVSPSLEFNIPGTYTVTLTVKDAADNSDTDTMTVTVNDITDPVADAGTDVTVSTGDEVSFDGSGSTDNVGIVNYTWTFTYGGETITLYGVSPTHTFDEEGSYTVTLTVRDAADNSDTDTMTVTVTEPPEDDDEPDAPCLSFLMILLSGLFVVPALILRRRR